MPQFDATIKHIQDGVKGFTVKAAITNIEGWEATLEKSEAAGVKTLGMAGKAEGKTAEKAKALGEALSQMVE